MSFSRWLRNWKNETKRPATRRRRPTRRMALERLEDRFCLSYTVVDLGSLGGSYSQAHALNEAGQVVGEAATAAYETHAFLWDNGVMTDLGTLGMLDENLSAATDINDSGQVVGYLGYGGSWGGDPPAPPPDRAFLWQNGVMTALMPDGGEGRAYAINNVGQIVGDVRTASGSFGAFVWEDGVMYDLDSLLPAGGNVQLLRANDINDNGQITGLASFNGYWAPFLLTDDDGIFANGGAVVTDLSGWGNYGEGTGLNNAGQAAGWMEFMGDGTNHAVLYSDGAYTDLGGDQATSYASAVNDAGQVVGKIAEWSLSTGYRAFLWQNGERTDLNSLIDSFSGWVLSNGSDINEGGEIVGSGTLAGETRAFLLVASSLPSLSIGDAVVTEGNAGTINANFIVTLSAASTETVTVNYSTANGSAVAGSDYQAGSGTLTFAPGETSQAIAILVNGDARDEFDETFSVNLSGPANAVLTKGVGLGTILDDDPPPSLTIGDVTLAEGNSGTTSAVFTVSLSAASGKTVFVDFATANGTAGSNDYAAKSGSVVFAPGETTKTITVLVNGDTRDEFDETFVVNLTLTSPTNATLADGQGVGTIQDDDPPPSMTINNVTLAEGQSGIRYFVFTVSLSAASDKAVSVNFGTANGSATTANNDYVAASGTLTFAPGETTKTITVQVKGDRKKEANETFFLNLSAALNALLADSQGLGTILNDD